MFFWKIKKDLTFFDVLAKLFPTVQEQKYGI